MISRLRPGHALAVSAPWDGYNGGRSKRAERRIIYYEVAEGLRSTQTPAVSGAVGDQARATRAHVVQVEGGESGDRRHPGRDDPGRRRPRLRWLEGRQARHEQDRREAGKRPARAA